MAVRAVTVTVERVLAGAELLVPTGIATPYEEIGAVAVDGVDSLRHVSARGLGLGALLARPHGDRIVIRYTVVPAATGSYPAAAFAPIQSRYTRPADALVESARDIAMRAGGGHAAIQALAEETQARFAYGHPPERFNDGLDHVPYLACGLTEGSCVDINTYFVACLRAAGFTAAYVYGYFFPAERGGITNDGHCWVVTRHADKTLEWDIAHHIKAGLGTVRPGLNPRPGRRVAVGHSMGHRYLLPDGLLDLKILAEPMWIRNGVVSPAERLLARVA